MISFWLFFVFSLSGLGVLGGGYIFSCFFLSMSLGILLGLSFFGSVSVKVGSFFVLDSLSFFLVLLTFWVFSMVFLLGILDILSFLLLLFLFGFLILSFSSFNVLWFYVFFECSMVPIFFIVLGWGSGEERLFSAYYMFFYTMFSSLPCLLVIFFLSRLYGLLKYDCYGYLGAELGGWGCFFFCFVFMVKVPIFIFHIWLPKAHVDAPVYGSMILASVMLKLGSYGLFRFIEMFGYSVVVFDFFFCVCLVGVFFVSLVSLYSVDMKVVVAYSSVVHMCMMVCGVLSGMEVGWWGGFYMALSHGICSSGLFMIINMYYSRSGSRLLFLNKGYLSVLPVLSFLWLAMIMGNIGMPPSLSFISEVWCLSSMVGDFYLSWVLAVGGVFLMSCVSMNLFLYGFGSWAYGFMESPGLVDYLLIFFHLFPLNFFMFFGGYFF